MRLEPGGWYGWTMFPGDSDCPYHSPIKVHRVLPLRTGGRLFDLHFFSLGFAEGVQEMTYRLRTLRREHHHILAAQVNGDHSVAIVPLTGPWLRIHSRDLWQLVALRIHKGGELSAAMDSAVNFMD